MLRTLLLALTMAGFHAAPLRENAIRFQHEGWMRRGPQLVQDLDRYYREPEEEKPERRTAQNVDVKESVPAEVRKAIPVELRRQGTEPSRRFLVDLNTGLLKEHVSEMERRVGNYYVPPLSNEFRQGTENSHATLVDISTGQLLAPISEMQRRVAHFGSQREVPTALLEENQKAVPVELRRQGTEPSRRFLVDISTGQLLTPISEMQRRVAHFGGQREVPTAPLEENQKAVPVELRRQGTEPSRRFLVDIRTGQLQAPISEMQRRVAHFGSQREVPTALLEENQKAVPVELRRQGTEPSRRFLVDIRTGQLQAPISEMQRRVAHFGSQREVPTALLEENQKAVPVELRRQGTEPSRRFLVDIRTGQLQAPISEMQRRVAHFGSQREVPTALLEENQKAVPVELRRQGTEPSKRFLVDIRTGQLQAPISEMQRRVAHIGGQREVPTAPLEENQKAVPVELRRQGTEPSRRFLVDIRTGQLQAPISEMQRRVAHFGSQREVPTALLEENQKAVPVELRRQGTEPSRRFLVDLNTGLQKERVSEMQRRVENLRVPEMLDEFRHGIEFSQANRIINHMMDPVEAMNNNEVEASSPHEEFKHSMDYVQANHIGNHFMVPIEALANNEVDFALPLEEFKHRAEYSQGNQINKHMMQPAEKQSLEPVTCPGEVIGSKCFHFNPTLLSFSDAESSCKQLSTNGHLAAVTNADLHARLVAMVTTAMKTPVLTWLGGTLKNGQMQWIDGSSWGYSDWMPGHPNTHSATESCMEMFRIDESWWTAVDCGLQRASICSFPMTA